MNGADLELTSRPVPAVAGPAGGRFGGAMLNPQQEDEPAGEIRAGLIVAALFFVLFLGWAAVARLDAAAMAPGRLVVSGQRQTVQHRDGGVVGDRPRSEPHSQPRALELGLGPRLLRVGTEHDQAPHSGAAACQSTQGLRVAALYRRRVSVFRVTILCGAAPSPTPRFLPIPIHL